ncbi:MAG: OmpA family protein [Bacteroidia bacterium]|nr:OmpA family protein [Bacteroidia bacterium]
MARSFFLAVWCTLVALPLLAQRKGQPTPVPGAEVNPDPRYYGISSKKALKLYEAGMVQYSYRRYGEALVQFQAALALEPRFGMAHFRTGEALFLDAQAQGAPLGKALPHLENALKAEPGWRPEAWNLFYYLAECYTQAQRYKEAEANYLRFLAPPARANASYQLRQEANLKLPSARFAAQAIEHPVQFEPHNLGPAINTEADEYLPYLTADDRLLFFTSRRKEGTGDYDNFLGGYPEDFFFSRYENGAWQPAENLGPPVNTPQNEGAACISPDGQYVFFTGCGRRDGQGDCDLYVAELSGTQWSKPQNLGPIVNSRFWDSHPNLANDGRTLFFASARPGGLGGTDIWMSTYSGAAWSEPRNLGAPINTPGNEYGPFLHADDRTFYFASDGHPGFGGRDLFLATRTDSGWSPPRNLGHPINTPGNEQNLFVNAAGTQGYFNSSTLRGLGKIDLYTFALDPSIRPQLRATFVRGTVRDSLTRKPIGAEVTLVRLSGSDTTRGVRSNVATGQFLTSLPLEDDYAAFVDAPGYLFYSQYFSLKGIEGQAYYDLAIALQPIRQGATVVLRNIFFAYDSAELLPESGPELANAVHFLTQNPSVHIEIGGHTDNVGGDSYNQTLSQARAQAVRDYLVGRGIAPGRLVAKGYGKTRPIATNDTETGRAQNRRTAFTILAN